MDLTQAIVARSDQLNADDLISGPRTFTITEVRRGDAEQPVSIVLAEYPSSRPFKPSKTVVRIFAYAWGKETDDWPENPRVTLYRDATVKWAGQEIGGIRVSHLSHIENHPDLKGGQLKVALAESKGKKSLHVVASLPADAPTAPVVSTATLADLTDTLARKGVPEAAWLSGANQIAGSSAPDLAALTEDQAQVVLAALAQTGSEGAGHVLPPDSAPGEAATSPASPSESPLLDTKSKLAKTMYAAIREAGITKDETPGLYREVTGREVESSKELTDDEARAVLDHLGRLKDAMENPFPGDAEPVQGELVEDES